MKDVLFATYEGADGGERGIVVSQPGNAGINVYSGPQAGHHFQPTELPTFTQDADGQGFTSVCHGQWCPKNQTHGIPCLETIHGRVPEKSVNATVVATGDNSTLETTNGTVPAAYVSVTGP